LVKKIDRKFIVAKSLLLKKESGEIISSVNFFSFINFDFSWREEIIMLKNKKVYNAEKFHQKNRGRT
jgi:hypothetical protein